MELELSANARRRLKTLIRKPGGSYLFLGPSGLGKFQAALDLAEQVRGDVLGLIVVENDRSSLGIDSIHQLNRQLQLKTAAGQRVAIIRDADKLTVEAQNAFLKTLEEPPANTTLILVAADRTKLLPTILSRCQPITFEPLGANEIEAQNAFLKTLEEPPANTTLILVAADRTKLLPTILSRCQPITFEPLGANEIEAYLINKGELDQPAAASLAALANGSLGYALALSEDQDRQQQLVAVDKITTILADKNSALDQKLAASLQPDIEPKLLIDRLIFRLRQQISQASGDGKVLASLQHKLTQAELAWRQLVAHVNPKIALTQLSLEMSR